MSSTDKKTDLTSWLLMLIAVAAIAGAGWIYFAPRLGVPDLPPLPDPPIEGLPDVVRKQIEMAYAEVHKAPRHPVTNGRLGMILHANGKLDAATVGYARARLLDPKSFEWAHYLGMALEKLGRDDEARSHMAEAVALNPDYLASRLELAEIELAAGRLTEAVHHFEAAVARGPDSPYAHYGLGKAFVAMGETTRALPHFRESVRLQPRYGEVHYALALAYRGEGDTERAAGHMALYQKHEGMSPPRKDKLLASLYRLNLSGRAIARKANTELREGRFSEAVALFERALTVDPALIEAHVQLIAIYGRLGNPALAEKHYREAIDKQPDVAGAHINFARLLATQARNVEATEIAELAIEQNPYDARPHIILGQIDEREGRVGAAIAQFEQASEKDPQNRRARFYLGKQQLLQGDREVAEQNLQASLEPDNADARLYYLMVAEVYERAGDRSEALEYLASARQRAAAEKDRELLALIEQIHRRWLEKGQTP